MKYEAIDAKQIDDLMARREVRPPEHWEPKDKKPDTTGSGGATATVTPTETPANEGHSS